MQIISARYPSKCAACLGYIARGERVGWIPGVVYHERCIPQRYLADDKAGKVKVSRGQREHRG